MVRELGTRTIKYLPGSRLASWVYSWFCVPATAMLVLMVGHCYALLPVLRQV